MRFSRLWSLAISFGVFCSCEEEPQQPDSAEPGKAYDLLICNEGNFNRNNGSVTTLRLNDGQVVQEAFKQVNGEPLGDVVQSAYAQGELLYLVVNNSGKIEIVDRTSFESVATIEGFHSPRYILPISKSKAYVSDLYANAVSIVDLNTRQVTGQIKLWGWTEEMLLNGDKVYISNYRSESLYVLDIATDALVDSVAIGKTGISLALGGEDDVLYVLHQGSLDNTLKPAISSVSLTTNRLIRKAVLNDNCLASRLCINPDTEEAYFICGGVLKHDTKAESISTKRFLAPGRDIFYGLRFEEGKLYVGNAKDYISQGSLQIYDAESSLLEETLPTGLIPGYILSN